MKSEYKVVCKRTTSMNASVPFKCTHGAGEAAPTYSIK